MGVNVICITAFCPSCGAPIMIAANVREDNPTLDKTKCRACGKDWVFGYDRINGKIIQPRQPS